MVLNEGSLRNTTMGVYTELYIDMQEADKIQHGIIVFRTLNDPVLYLALLPEYCVTTPPPPSPTPQQALDQRRLARITAAGSSSCTTQEAWLVAHASLQHYHHSWYIFSWSSPSHPFLPPPPFPLLIRSVLPPCHEVRHRLVKGEPLGRGTLILRSQKLSFIRAPCKERHLKHNSVMQDFVDGAERSAEMCAVHMQTDIISFLSSLSYSSLFPPSLLEQFQNEAIPGWNRHKNK